ncbi:MAG: efflux RND transporter permease subunit [Porticoccaceae bacterium]
MKKIISAGIRATVVYPKIIIFVALVLSLLLIAGAPKFEVDASVKRYIGEDSPVVEHLNFLEAEYIQDSNVLLMVKPHGGTVFAPEVLAAIAEMTEMAWQIPNIRRVDSLTNFQHTQVEGDDLVVEELVSAGEPLSSEDVERIRAIVLNEVRLVGALVDEQGSVAALNMLFTVDMSDHGALSASVEGVAKLREAFADGPVDIAFHETGFVTMMYEMTKTAAQDAAKLYTLALVFIVVFLTWFFASVRAALAVLFIGLLAVLVAVGFYGWIGGYLTPPTAMGTLMVLILGIADGVHIVKSARRYLAQGNSTRDAVREAVAANFTPVALTSITTAIGFLSFNLNDFTGIKLMGNFVAFGVMVAFVLSLTLLPALLCYCGLKPAKSVGDGSGYERLAELAIRHRTPILAATVLLTLVSAFSMRFNTIDDSISRHIKPSHPFRQDTRQIEEDLTGSVPVIYSFAATGAAGVADPGFMAQVDQFVRWARAQPEVRYVSAYTDTMKQLNQDLNGGDPALYRLPDNEELAAQYLLLYEMSLPYGLDLGNQLNMDKSATRLVLSIDDLTLLEMKAFLERGQHWLAANAPEFDSFANSSVLCSNLTVEESIWNTLSGAMLALAVIALFLMLTFRAIMPGVLCAIAVLAPLVVTFGLWGLAVGIVDLPAALALCMVIGITVDFGIHFIVRELHGRRALGYDSRQSIRYTFSYVGAPILTSTLALGVGFLVLVLGQFQFAARMGLLTALCIGLSMVMTFMFLPALLLLGERRASDSPVA